MLVSVSWCCRESSSFLFVKLFGRGFDMPEEKQYTNGISSDQLVWTIARDNSVNTNIYDITYLEVKPVKGNYRNYIWRE